MRNLNLKISRWAMLLPNVEVPDTTLWHMSPFTESVDSCLAVMPGNWGVSITCIAEHRYMVTVFALIESYEGEGDTRAEALALALGAAIDAGEKP